MSRKRVESDSAPLGSFEEQVMLAVARVKSEAYAVTVRREIEDQTGREIAMGAVYATLDRLTDKGLVRSWLSDPRPERGGRSRRYFRLEPAGERALRDAAQAARRMIDAIERSWGSGARRPANSG